VNSFRGLMPPSPTCRYEIEPAAMSAANVLMLNPSSFAVSPMLRKSRSPNARRIGSGVSCSCASSITLIGVYSITQQARPG
jgi:hypothetical protein